MIQLINIGIFGKGTFTIKPACFKFKVAYLFCKLHLHKPLNSLKHQYCLNALFYLYQTKSIFRPASGHWILTLHGYFVSFEQKEADCTIFVKKFVRHFGSQ